MKKSLLGLLLAVALVVPAFAAKGDMSINGKIGLGVSNNLNSGNNNVGSSMSLGMPFSIGAEFFYGLMDNLSVGLGVDYGFKSKFEANGTFMGYPMSVEAEGRTTNIYLAVKPEAKLDSKIFSSMYLLGQIGLSSIEYKSTSTFSSSSNSGTADMGIYLGFGAGVTIKDNFIVEFIISSSNGTTNQDGEDVDMQYTAATINLGYKFSL